MLIARRDSVLVTLATTDHLDMARQFFASAHFNAGWAGDYLLLAHEVEDAELDWFYERGIQVEHCSALYPGPIGGMHACLTTKYYLFTSRFRQWKTVIYSDADAIVRAPLEALRDVRAFASVADWSPSLHQQFVTFREVRERGLDRALCARLKRLARARYDFSRQPFCAGFFAFPTSLLQEATLSGLKEMTDRFELCSKFGDQLAMNLYFYDRWQRLSPTFNILVRQRNYPDPKNGNYRVETRWGAVTEVSAHILHVFDPKPWDPASGFHEEWLSNLKRSSRMDLSTPPPIDPERLLAVDRTEQQIRFRQKLYDLLEHLGPAKTIVIKILEVVYWGLVKSGLLSVFSGSRGGRRVLRHWGMTTGEH